MFILFLICAVICTSLYLYDKRITTPEYFIMLSAVLITSFIMFVTTLVPIPNDIYYQSGRFIKVAHFPYFVEEYQQRHEQQYPCGSDSDGNTKYCTRVWYTTEHAKHQEHWVVYDSLNQSEKIKKKEYIDIGKQFKDIEHRSFPNRCTHGGHTISGDDSMYYYDNVSNTYQYPTTAIEYWHNPLKGKISLFTHKNTSSLSYPKQYDWRHNDRNLSNIIPNVVWDSFNTKVYEMVGANVILVPAVNINDLDILEDSWNKGKQNDIIIGYVGNLSKPDAVHVFGWYKSNITAITLETFILDNGITVNNLDKLLDLINTNYQSFDFSQFKYLNNPPSFWQILFTILINIIVICFAYNIVTDNEDNRLD